MKLEMSFEEYKKVCETSCIPTPEKLEDKLKLKCPMCNWMEESDKEKKVYGFRHCGKFCNCFCHVLSPHFNGSSYATDFEPHSRIG